MIIPRALFENRYVVIIETRYFLKKSTFEYTSYEFLCDAIKAVVEVNQRNNMSVRSYFYDQENYNLTDR